MRFASALSLSWEPQPEAQVGPFYSVMREPPFAVVPVPYLGALSVVRPEPPCEAVAVPYPFQRRQPERPLEVEEPRLFQAVADLTDGAAALHFAVRWGLLFERSEWLALQPLPEGETRPVQWAGQRLEGWLAAGAEMREAVALWRAICERDRKAMGEVVRVVSRGPGSRSAPAYNGVRGGFSIYQALPRPSLTDAARLVLAKLVNDRIDAAPQLRYDGARPHRLGQVLRPRSLYGAAWAQLLEHVGRDEARACPRCGRIFIVYLEASGRRPEHCSDACRLAMHRRRKKAAGRRKKA